MTKIGWRTPKWSKSGVGHFFSKRTDSSPVAVAPCGRHERICDLQLEEEMVSKCKVCLKTVK